MNHARNKLPNKNNGLFLNYYPKICISLKNSSLATNFGALFKIGQLAKYDNTGVTIALTIKG